MKKISIFFCMISLLVLISIGLQYSNLHVIKSPESYIPKEPIITEEKENITYEEKTYPERTKKEKREEKEILVVKNPNDAMVLVNKSHRLPDDFSPKDLVNSPVPFIFNGNSERRKLRSDASDALVKLFDAAEKENLPLIGVSGYRSYLTQTALFNSYVTEDGYERARTYSAIPGTSEHETGLAIDVTSMNGRCPAEDCFGNTKEAKWLEANASNYGFIIRYPKGKESITGYKYEPWHLRYVGKTAAKEMVKNNLTLEEFINLKSVSK